MAFIDFLRQRGVILLMIKKNQRQINRLHILSDGVLIWLSYLFAAWLWLDVVKGDSANMAAISGLHDYLVAALYAVWTVIVMAAFRLYRHTRLTSDLREAGTVVMSSAVALVSAAALLYLFRLEDFSRGVLGVFFVTSCAALNLKRVAMRITLKRMRARGYNQKHVVVVGGGTLAARYTETVASMPHLGIHVECSVSRRKDETAKELQSRLEAEIHGDGIDEVVVALGPDEIDQMVPVIQICEKCGTKTSVIPFYNDVIPTQPTIDAVGDLKLVQLRTTPMDEPVNAFVKRAFDIVCSLILILLTSPIMLVAVIGTKLSSPGPILFKQERVGLNKKNFMMYKFRSMKVNNTQDTGWSGSVDDRRTKFGSLIRKTSIDELPQFFNVLKGDMSIVGPRPEVPFYVEQFRESVPLYMVKYQVRPGITGWAQINGLRGDTSIPDRIRHDLWYIEHWTFWLDLKIIFRTAFGGMINAEKLR